MLQIKWQCHSSKSANNQSDNQTQLAINPTSFNRTDRLNLLLFLFMFAAAACNFEFFEHFYEKI